MSGLGVGGKRWLSHGSSGCARERYGLALFVRAGCVENANATMPRRYGRSGGLLPVAVCVAAERGVVQTWVQGR